MIASRGAKGWQVQLTVAMGNAVDNDRHAAAAVSAARADAAPRGARTTRRTSLGVMMLARQQHRLLRSLRAQVAHRQRREAHWSGCSAGPRTSSASKPTAPSRAVRRCRPRGSAGGNVRDMTHRRHLGRYSRELRFSRDRQINELWGCCRDLLLRGRLPRRLHLDVDGALRPSRQQPVLPPPRARAREAGTARTRGENAGGAGHAVRSGTFRSHHRAARRQRRRAHDCRPAALGDEGAGTARHRSPSAGARPLLRLHAIRSRRNNDLRALLAATSRRSRGSTRKCRKRSSTCGGSSRTRMRHPRAAAPA